MRASRFDGVHWSALRWARQAFATLLLALFSVSVSADGTRPIPAFGVNVEIVSLNVAATDKKGRNVMDLGEQEIAIFEDGVPQQISLFTRERWPLSLSVLVDCSGSMKTTLPLAQEAAIRLLRTLEPRDQAQVAQFNRRLRVLVDFSSDMAALEKAVRSIEADGDTALYSALYITLKDLQARRREGELSRQAIVVLTDGDDTASAASDEQVLALARKAQVGIYAIALTDETREAALGSPIPKYFLTSVTRETGGTAFFPTKGSSLRGIYDQIAEDLRTLYGVGYVSSNPMRDGKWRTIQIQSRREDLMLRHRAGYYAAGRSPGLVLPPPAPGN
jgi:Ca-activated chloride channel homolog